YTAEAAALGLRAQVTLRLYVNNHSIANLNLYSTDSETVSEDTVAMAEVYASHVTAVLGRSETQDELTSAMLTRQLIGQATGILMERLQLGPDEAFAYLLRISSTRNVKVRDLARRVVAGEDLDGAARRSRNGRTAPPAGLEPAT
ncbi:MAG: uncharacterized protein JWR20_1728, partial [Marmoricola sp.]|nr:uncharacterized protein [Marmoricola sp.]